MCFRSDRLFIGLILLPVFHEPMDYDLSPPIENTAGDSWTPAVFDYNHTSFPMLCNLSFDKLLGNGCRLVNYISVSTAALASDLPCLLSDYALHPLLPYSFIRVVSSKLLLYHRRDLCKIFNNNGQLVLSKCYNI